MQPPTILEEAAELGGGSGESETALLAPVDSGRIVKPVRAGRREHPQRSRDVGRGDEKSSVLIRAVRPVEADAIQVDTDFQHVISGDYRKRIGHLEAMIIV